MPHEQHKECISICHECAVECNHCASACLAEDDVSSLAKCIQLNLTCAGICQLAVSEMSRGSEHAGQVCKLCADICEACADECGSHEHGHCRECAQVCRRCAEECRRMVQESAIA